MSLAPLLNAAPVIQVHAFAATAAFALGVVQLSAPKGTLPHRTMGWIWVTLMALVAISSFWIHELRMIGPFSPIHFLSIFTLVTLPIAVLHAHRHNVIGHRRSMIAMFTGALVIAGPHHARGAVRELRFQGLSHAGRNPSQPCRFGGVRP
jgi:uncharacterized membrane protein